MVFVCVCVCSATVWCEHVPVFCCQQPQRPAQCTDHCGSVVGVFYSWLVIPCSVQWYDTAGLGDRNNIWLACNTCPWRLPVHYRIQFKIATLTYKTLATCQPSYLYNLLQVYHPSRALCSSTQQLLHVPYMSTDFVRSAFSYSSPATWNSIPISIKNCSSLYSFKRHLKSHFIAQLINN